VTGKEIIIAATRDAHAMLTRVDEINYLSGPGKGVILVKLSSKDDAVLGFRTATGDRDLLRVETSRGAELTIRTRAAAARPVHTRASAGNREPSADRIRDLAGPVEAQPDGSSQSRAPVAIREVEQDAERHPEQQPFPRLPRQARHQHEADDCRKRR
jgi:hypothetical protein